MDKMSDTGQLVHFLAAGEIPFSLQDVSFAVWLTVRAPDLQISP